MGLQEKILTAGQSLQGMEVALWHRLDEAEVLRDAGRSTGAVYLYGYVAEMKVKCVLFRLLGLPGETPWTGSATNLKQALQDEKNALETAGERFEGFGWDTGHGLLYCAAVLTKSERRCSGDSQRLRGLLRHVWEIQQRWAVQMRYWPGQVTVEDCTRVAQSVSWLLKHA